MNLPSFILHVVVHTSTYDLSIILFILSQSATPSSRPIRPFSLAPYPRALPGDAHKRGV